VSTDTLFRSTSHPPCPQGQEILEITVPADRTELTVIDRLSLRLGLWLTLRAQRQRRSRTDVMSRDEMLRMLSDQRAAGIERFTEREALAMFTYDMHRQMR